MLFDLTDLSRQFECKVTGILHVGAHKGEENLIYSKLNWSPVLWVEAQENLVAELKEILPNDKNYIFQGVVDSVCGKTVQLKIASNSESTSILNFGSHARDYDWISYINEIEVKTIRLDCLLKKVVLFPSCNFLNIDIQGLELAALKSLGERLRQFDFIYTEVNRKFVYQECSLVWEIDEFLTLFGFHRAKTRWVLGKGWGDAFYVKGKVSNFDKWIDFPNEWKFFYRPQLWPLVYYKFRTTIPNWLRMRLRKVRLAHLKFFGH